MVGKGAVIVTSSRQLSLNLIKLSQFSPHYRNSCENFPFNLYTPYGKYNAIECARYRKPQVHSSAVILFDSIDSPALRSSIRPDTVGQNFSLFHEKLRLHRVIGAVHHAVCKRAKEYHWPSRFTGLANAWGKHRSKRYSKPSKLNNYEKGRA